MTFNQHSHILECENKVIKGKEKNQQLTTKKSNQTQRDTKTNNPTQAAGTSGLSPSHPNWKPVPGPPCWQRSCPNPRFCLSVHTPAFFNISPSPSAFTIYSNFPDSAFALSWKGHVAPFSPGTRSPAHRWSCRDFGCDFGSSSALWKHIDTSNAPGPV